MQTKDKDNILPKLNFEDRYYLANMCDKVLSSSSEELISHLSAFNSCLVSNKLLYRINQYEHNGSPNAQVTSSIKIIKIISLMSIYKQEYFYCEENELNVNTDINLLIHNIYKLLCTEQDILFTANNNSKGDNIELDIITSIIFGKYLTQEGLTYEKIKLLIDANQPNNSNNLSYELFQKNYKIFIKFYLLCDRFGLIYSQLENKDKVGISEFALGLNKVIKRLNEQNLFYSIAKKFIELIDGNQLHFTKVELYTLLIKSLNI